MLSTEWKALQSEYNGHKITARQRRLNIALGLDVPLIDTVRYNSALEQSNSYCHIATAALERCSTPIDSHVYHLMHEHIHTLAGSSLRRTMECNTTKADMLPVTHTCTIPGEM